MDPMDFLYLDYGNDDVDEVDRPYISFVRQSLNSSNLNSSVKVRSSVKA
jgi:hypothetical protein